MKQNTENFHDRAKAYIAGYPIHVGPLVLAASIFLMSKQTFVRLAALAFFLLIIAETITYFIVNNKELDSR